MTIFVAQIIFLCTLSYKLINLKLIHSQVHRPELTGILSHFSICLCHCETNYYGQSNNNSQPHSQLAHQRCAKVLSLFPEELLGTPVLWRLSESK
jgi:hypothetical protein